MYLTRKVRLNLSEQPQPPRPTNNWSGTPSVDIPAPFVEISLCVSGSPDPATGYICDIGLLDKLVRDTAFLLWQPTATPRITWQMHLGTLFAELLHRLPPAVQLHSITLQPSPFTRYDILQQEQPMIRITQSFEFSASHRLHVDTLSPAENQRIFGKCNNPHGHGHNYTVDITLSGSLDPHTGVLIPLETLDTIVNDRVIARFDHKHLNLDCPEFASLNPSVENIAQVIWSKLNGAFQPARLVNIRVWETPKTFVDYAGDNNP